MKKIIYLYFLFFITVINLQSQNLDTVEVDVNFEDLLLEEISGDLKYNDMINQTGSSITVITADEIEKKGFNSFNDIIEYVADCYFSTDGTWNYIGVRGLLFASSYGTRVPVTIDGNQLTDYTFGSILNSNILEISLKFIEKIEIIQGSPSLLYGSNAILGAINIVTKYGKDFTGGVAQVGVTSAGQTYTDIVLGNKWESGLDVMFSYRMTHFKGNNIYFEEYDNNTEYGDTNSILYNDRASNSGVANHKNNFFGNIFYLKSSYNNFELNAIHTISSRRYPSASFGTIFNDENANFDVSFTNVVISYNYTTNFFGINHNIKPKLTYNHSKSDLYYNYLFKGENEERDTLWNQIERPIFSGIGIELSDIMELSSHSTAVIGVNYLGSINYDVAFLEGENNSFDDISENVLEPLKIFAGYLKYTNELTDWFSFFAGIRYENSIDYKESVLLPRVGVIFDIGNNSIIKGLFGTAARRPSGYEEYSVSTIDTVTGELKMAENGLLNYEKSKSFELIYLHRTNNFIINTSIFCNNIQNIIYEDTIPFGLVKPDAEYPYIYINSADEVKIWNYGLSFSAKYKTDFGLEIMLSDVYAFTDITGEYNYYLTDAIKNNSFANTLIYSVSYPIIDFLTINLIGRYETNRKTIDIVEGKIIGLKNLPVTNTLNMSLTYRPLYKENNLDFLNKFYASLVFNNILNNLDYYPVSSSLGVISKYPRNNGYSIGISIGYNF